MYVTEYLSPHFTFNEMTDSVSHPELVATNRVLAHKPENLKNLRDLASMLEVIRTAWGAPLTVNSGYRDEVLNSAINGSTTSEHKLAKAADLDAGDLADNTRLFELIKSLIASKTLTVGELILEGPPGRAWVHVSTPGRFKNKVLTYDGKRFIRS